MSYKLLVGTLAVLFAVEVANAFSTLRDRKSLAECSQNLASVVAGRESQEEQLGQCLVTVDEREEQVIRCGELVRNLVLERRAP